jgi:hypothetical protein
MGARHCEQRLLIAQHDPPLRNPGRQRGYSFRRFSIHRECLPFRITVYANSISAGEWGYIYSAIDGIGVTAKAVRLSLENPTAHKKTAEKALIPLPPASVGYLFCATTSIMQTKRCALRTAEWEGAPGYCTICKVLQTIEVFETDNYIARRMVTLMGSHVL